jgi:adenine-specific DNA-methyltransferase
MEKANMHSLDMVNENIKKIGSIFPECVTETVDENGNVKAAIDFEKLQENLSHATIGEGEERYQFTWPGKREAIHNANAPTNMTLRPCKEESVDFDKTENLYIEGDNLEVLKLLQENYLGKVKMIYIDPPYNTGSDGFVYNDKFRFTPEELEKKLSIDEDEAKRILDLTSRGSSTHSAWLMFMSPRLQLARELLSKDGVIFISIDDNEQANLKLLCDEIFIYRNFVNCVSIKAKSSFILSIILLSMISSIKSLE